MEAIAAIINKDGRPANNYRDSLAKIISNEIEGEGYIFFEHSLFIKFPSLTDQNGSNTIFRRGQISILSNGKLFNRTNLVKQLKLTPSRHEQFSDNEIIRLAFLEWGKDCISKIEGEFSLIAWNNETKRLYATVDHVGSVPLYYYEGKEQIIVATDLKFIEKIKRTPHRFDPETLIEYFWRKHKAPEATYNSDIKYLPGGNYIIADEVSFKIVKYWVPENTGKYRFKKDTDWYECFREHFKVSILNRLKNHSKIGIRLSGGLDSSGITVFLAKILREKNLELNSFSSVLPELYNGHCKDEKEYLKVLQNHCSNLHQTYVETESVDPFTNLEESFEIDNSIPNPYFAMDHALLRKAKEQKIDLLYSGSAGDFWATVHGNSVAYHLFKRLNFVKGAKVLASFYKNYPTSIPNLIQYQILRNNSIYKRILDSKIASNDKAFLSVDLSKNYPINTKGVDVMFQLPEIFIENRFGYEIGKLFFNRFHYYGIESAVPFLDKELLVFLAHVPIELYVKGGLTRGFFRSAMKDALPDFIRLRRTKSPYVPDFEDVVCKSSKIDSLNNSNNFLFPTNYFKDEEVSRISAQILDNTCRRNRFSEVMPYVQLFIAGSVIKILQKKNYDFK